MELSPDSAALPPAYTPTAPAAPTTLYRTMEDTRTMILANAWIIRSNMKVGDYNIVMGKTRGPAAPTTGARSFVSQTSNVTIRLRDESPSAQATQERSVTPERRPSDSGLVGTRVAGKHYASLVAKELQTRTIEVIILGEPQDTVEEALEWLLDRSEIVVTEMLANHRKQALTTCCRSCGNALIAN